MKTNRRIFFKIAGAAGAGVLSGSLPSLASSPEKSHAARNMLGEWNAGQPRKQFFNMCGYAAPKLETVRIGFIGLGNRGHAAVERIAHIEGIQVAALCDKSMERVEKAQQLLPRYGLPPARAYGGNPEAWKDLCQSQAIDLVYICTPWNLHASMAIMAMQNGKHAATEVPAATTFEETWQLVETSEETKKHCMMLENCCYDFFELLTLNMARQGFFGEVVHTEGAYIHDLLHSNFDKNSYSDMWRLKENQHRNGNLYPTHGLGPVCQVLNINRGDAMDYLTSLSTGDFQMETMAGELAKADDFYKPYATPGYRGNMNTTLIRTLKGKSIIVQHDVTSPRPYSRIHLISGTRGFASKWPEPERIAQGHEWFSSTQLEELYQQYTPEIVKRVGEMAREIGGHGGMDFMMDWRLIDCLRNGLPLDQDVYDAALWSCIAPLSEWSVANRSAPATVPDFTCGAYKTNQPVDISLSKGGNTGVRPAVGRTESQLEG